MPRPNSISAFSHVLGIIKHGSRVRIISREQTHGTGVVTDILVWKNTPATMVLQMDQDTVYTTTKSNGLPVDEIRIPDTGVFGGEIVEILTVN